MSVFDISFMLVPVYTCANTSYSIYKRNTETTPDCYAIYNRKQRSNSIPSSDMQHDRFVSGYLFVVVCGKLTTRVSQVRQANNKLCTIASENQSLPTMMNQRTEELKIRQWRTSS